jgi:hypothetical protein
MNDTAITDLTTTEPEEVRDARRILEAGPEALPPECLEVYRILTEGLRPNYGIQVTLPHSVYSQEQIMLAVAVCEWMAGQFEPYHPYLQHGDLDEDFDPQQPWGTGKTIIWFRNVVVADERVTRA